MGFIGVVRWSPDPAVLTIVITRVILLFCAVRTVAKQRLIIIYLFFHIRSFHFKPPRTH